MHGGSVAEGFAEAVLTSNQIKRNQNHSSFVLKVVLILITNLGARSAWVELVTCGAFSLRALAK